MDRRTAEGALLIELAGRLVEYRFARRRRRTIGISIDGEGLRVAAPLRAPWREVEGFLRAKQRWIVAKLDEWAVAPRPAVLRVESGERLPLLGEMVELCVRPGPAHFGPLAERCARGEISIHVERTFPLEEVPAALAHVGAGRALGRVVVVP